jgi:hypothetical protein
MGAASPADRPGATRERRGSLGDPCLLEAAAAQNDAGSTPIKKWLAFLDTYRAFCRPKSLVKRWNAQGVNPRDMRTGKEG